MDKTRQNGIYYTKRNPFRLFTFYEWACEIGLKDHTILEPFAGANDIIRMLTDCGWCKDFRSYDIDPKSDSVIPRNSIVNFPTGFKTCITNPPWLARYSATRRCLSFPDTKYDDVYKECLKLALDNCKYVAFIIPATFLNSKLFRERLASITFFQKPLFMDTTNPACLALFNADATHDTMIYYEDTAIGTLSQLEAENIKPSKNSEIKFNNAEGELGLICIDNTVKPSIRFCFSHELDRVPRNSDRYITKIKTPFPIDNIFVDRLNKALADYRYDTFDVFLSPFKGIRKDDHLRRRIDYGTARAIIEKTFKQYGSI